ncbi:RNA-directed DNA polymerase, eukaryota [Tanacetum coccineum]|uniref:RNA-directed DNA polymerase, eukaryota n=1 Tax=Tanacetum coccineum TaxID=301880 RepID=A0ABQ4WD54_9ASTR
MRMFRCLKSRILVLLDLEWPIVILLDYEKFNMHKMESPIGELHCSAYEKLCKAERSIYGLKQRIARSGIKDLRWKEIKRILEAKLRVELLFDAGFEDMREMIVSLKITDRIHFHFEWRRSRLEKLQAKYGIKSSSSCCLVNAVDSSIAKCSLKHRDIPSSLDSDTDNGHILKDLLFFLHVPRTGGRTYFHWLLVTHDDYSMVSKLPGEKTSVVTILRDPIERVSVLMYFLNRGGCLRVLVHHLNMDITSKMVWTKGAIKRRRLEHVEIFGQWKYWDLGLDGGSRIILSGGGRVGYWVYEKGLKLRYVQCCKNAGVKHQDLRGSDTDPFKSNVPTRVNSFSAEHGDLGLIRIVSCGRMLLFIGGALKRDWGSFSVGGGVVFCFGGFWYVGWVEDFSVECSVAVCDSGVGLCRRGVTFAVKRIIAVVADGWCGIKGAEWIKVGEKVNPGWGECKIRLSEVWVVGIVGTSVFESWRWLWGGWCVCGVWCECGGEGRMEVWGAVVGLFMGREWCGDGWVWCGVGSWGCEWCSVIFGCWWDLLVWVEMVGSLAAADGCWLWELRHLVCVVGRLEAQAVRRVLELRELYGWFFGLGECIGGGVGTPRNRAWYGDCMDLLLPLPDRLRSQAACMIVPAVGPILRVVRVALLDFVCSARRHIPDALLKEIISLNSLDMELYKHAKEIFQRQHQNMEQELQDSVTPILNGPFILNEVLKWCKVKKKQALIFKVDFEKAYDSVRWDFLDEVLSKFGFGDKWRKWIQCCLRSSRGSIIVNGSPTEEFQFGRCLKQGDPLSPFLFILIMESLHLSFQRVVDVGMFQDIKLGASVDLSHMFYADDAVFVEQWNDSNITTLVHVLECFYRVSGLKINMGKSKIMGVHVDNAKVFRVAVKLRCLILKAPFSYLGSIVGGDMNRLQTWNDIVDRVKRRLSKWKMTTLSIGGRLTLVKSVLGGKLKDRFPRLYTLETCKWVTVGRKIAQPSLMHSFRRPPRGGAEQAQMEELETLMQSVILTPISDRMTWKLDSSGEFYVASVRKLIDNKLLPEGDHETRWIKFVPMKVNIHAWKVMADSLPTRFNISRRGIDIDSLVCVNCDRGVETSRHLFFEYCMAKQVTQLINRWWDVSDMEIDSYERWKTWLVNI